MKDFNKETVENEILNYFKLLNNEQLKEPKLIKFINKISENSLFSKRIKYICNIKDVKSLQIDLNIKEVEEFDFNNENMLANNYLKIIKLKKQSFISRKYREEYMKSKIEQFEINLENIKHLNTPSNKIIWQNYSNSKSSQIILIISF